MSHSKKKEAEAPEVIEGKIESHYAENPKVINERREAFIKSALIGILSNPEHKSTDAVTKSIEIADKLLAVLG